MPDYPPFMNSYGLIPKILQKIKDAKTPERFTQDYLGTTLGFASGAGKAFIPFAKRIGFLGSDGTPTEIYHQFRNPDHSKGAMAHAIRIGYSDLFARNENADKLDHKGLEGLVVQATGLDSGSSTLRAIVNSFENLKQFADFARSETVVSDAGKTLPAAIANTPVTPVIEIPEDMRLGLSYTINIVLPKSDDVAVYSAIFRALKENLLRR